MANFQLHAGTLAFVSALKTAAAKVYHSTSNDGEKLVQGFEGLRLKAYLCPAGKWTIGWGSTFYANGTPVKKGDVLPNRECADDLLEHTLKLFANQVNALVRVPINQNQFDALVSFNFNTGGLAGSTLLKLLNAGDYAGAANEFPKWNKVTNPKTKIKEVNPVLVARRAKELRLFLKP